MGVRFEFVAWIEIEGWYGWNSPEKKEKRELRIGKGLEKRVLIEFKKIRRRCL